MASRTRKAQPPKHGQIKAGGGMTVEHMKAHLANMTASAAEVRDYGGHSATGFSSQGAMSPGGASGADYSTTSTSNTGDADSQGPTGY